MPTFRKKPAVQQLRLSWSAIQTFLSCQRKYDLAYRENLQRKPSAEHRNLILGSAFHAGVEAALRLQFWTDYAQHVQTTEWLVTEATAAARNYIKGVTVTNKMVKDYHNGGLLTHDFAYYAMIREVSQLVVELLRYHVPLIGLGSRYIVPSVDDVLSGEEPIGRPSNGRYYDPDSDWPDVQPAVEWHFEYEVDGDTTLTGYIDTVLWDVEQQDYVMVDWKTRNLFPHDSMALIDGQLHLYAAVVNALAERPVINQVMMYQMLTKPPAPASIGKNGLPNTGATGYATTWEVWSATLPAGLEAEDYYLKIKDKLKTDDYFQRPIRGAVTETSSTLAMANVDAAVVSIRSALASGMPLPAILSSNGCKFCDFAMLCGNVLRYGGDAQSTLDDQYQPRVAEDKDEAVE